MMMMNDTICITKSIRREENALRNTKVYLAFDTDDELIDFMKRENLICHGNIHESEKCVLSYDEYDEYGNPIYLPHIYMMYRESRKNKPTFIHKAIRTYKVEQLLNEQKEDTTTDDMSIERREGEGEEGFGEGDN